MRTVAIIQAHMSSSRLPGKVLMDLAGRSVLERVVSRVRMCREVDDVVIAMSVLPIDDVIVEACERIGVAAIRGSEDDVLDRFMKAAIEADAEVCVRITSDCPLIDFGVSDHIIRIFKDAQPAVDYASNKIPQSYPRGLDTEVFTVDALDRTWRSAKQDYERRHVTIHMYEHPEAFRLLSTTSDVDRADWRWCIDTWEDYMFVSSIYDQFHGRDDFTWTEVLEYLEQNPDLMDINRHVTQKAAREG